MPVHFILIFLEMKKVFFTLFFTLFLCVFSNAQNIEVIETELQNVLNQKSNDLIDVNIYFKSQINAKQLSQKTKRVADKSIKREIVVSELKGLSEEIQSDVLSVLKAEELNGNVSEINCLWIANSINCKATRDVIYKLSSHPDIKALGYNKEIQVISPEEVKEVSSAEIEKSRATASHHILTINADDVWSQGYTGKNVVVAVLDSGTNYEHKDIESNLWEGYVDGQLVNGWNFIAKNSDISDDNGHGTHCAGIVCGNGTSGTSTGVAPDAKLMTVKIVNRAGTGTPADMLSGVQFAVENGANILSMSLGFKKTQLSVAQIEAIRSTFDNVLKAGVIVCAAAGNDGNSWGAPNNVDYPAACPAPWRNPDQTLEGGLSSVVCVGGSDLIGSSSQGPSTWEDTKYNDYRYNEGASMGLIRPDISAPGNLIFSLNYLISDKYKLMSGTSQSTPVVAGVMALMLEKNSTLTPAQISEIIETTAASKPATKNNVVGAGRVDALAAVNAVAEGTKKVPYIKFESVAPQVITQGDGKAIKVKVKNVGKGSSAVATSATLSLANDEYVTIPTPTVTLGQISTGNTNDVEFVVNVNSQTPNGHVANFTLDITSGDFAWKYPFSVKITSTPDVVFSSVTPGSINVNQDVNINVTMKNNGTAAMNGNTELTLSALSGDLKYITIVDNSATVGSMEVGGTGTGSFTIRADKDTPHNYRVDFFMETYSKSEEATNLVYEFENDNEGWTSFAVTNNVAEPWWHSTKALEHGKKGKDSHSGKGHLMSETVGYSSIEYASPIDNYLVSPTKVLATRNTEVSFYARAHENAYYKEHFGLAVSTSGNSSANDFTMLQVWTITKQQGTSWNKYTVNLGAYAGQEIYVAIRHFFTSEEWADQAKADEGHGVDALNIDDVLFTNVMMDNHSVPTYSGDDKNMFSVYVYNMKELAAVKNLVATAKDETSITLTWDAVEDAQSYNIYRDGAKLANVKTNSYEDSNLTHNTTYNYTVAAVYSNVEFDHSDEASATTKQKDYSIAVKDYEPKTSKTIYVGVNESDLRLTIANDGMYQLPSKGNIVLSCDNPYVTLRSITPGTPILPDDVKPSAPSVKVTATGDTYIELTWNNVLGATSYNIYHGTSTYNTTNNYYTINGLTPSTYYCFNITAVNSVGESAASEACATTHAKVVTKPSAPTNLTVVATTTATGENAFILSWNEVADATSYNVYNGTSTIVSGLTETTYTVTGSGTNTLVNGTEYCYYVTAVNSGGESNASAEVCATAGAIQYRIRRANATQYLTAKDDKQHKDGAYGGVAVAPLNATSKNQIFTLEDAGNDRFYLLSANNKYIKCWAWNVDAYSDTDKTALKKVGVGTGDGYYIQNCDNGKYFKVESNAEGNGNFVYGDCDGSNGTKEIWVFEPVAPTASKSAKRSTTAGDPISAEISALDANVEVTSDFVVEIDPSIPNNTEIILNINVNNNNITSVNQKYNMDLSVKMIVKNDIGTPKGVTITDVKDKSLTVKWNAVANAKYYNVYRDGSFLITTHLTSIFESDLDPETTYCYTVTGVNNDGESEPSMEVCATTLEKIGEVKVVSFEIGSAIGSNVSLKTRLINDSKSTTPANTVATLTCSNPNVTIVNGTATVGALASKATTDVTFTVKIASTIPYNETIDFDVTVTYESTGETLRDLKYTFDEGFDNWSCFSWQLNGKKWLWNSEKQCLESYSYGDGLENTNNSRANTYIVSPERMKLSENTKIKFDVDPTGVNYYQEKFSVYVSELAPPVDGYVSNQIHSVHDHPALSSADPQTIEISSTLSSWVGKEVYVIIRHYDCYENSLLLDNVIIQNVVSSGTVNITNTSSFSVTVNQSINTFNGSGAWNLASNWSKGSTPTITEDVIINGNATIESGNIAAKSITINSGSLTINSGATLTVSDLFLNKNPKAFIINDGAQVFQNNANVVATYNMLIDRPMSWGNDTKGGWQFIASPITNAKIDGFKPESETDYDLFKYDGTQELQWINYKNHGTDFETTFQQGRGYIVSYEAETTAEFEGIINNARTFSFTDVKAYDAENHYNNFYLLGNPFPFNMDWGKMTISGVYNGYATISNIDGSYDYHTSGTINAGDGFMVKSTGATPVLSYAHNVRSSAEKHASLDISASNIYGSDNVIINLAGQEEEGFTKLDNLNENIAEIYVENAGAKYGIFSFDEDVNEVKLGFRAAKPGTHIIRVNADGNFEYVTLVDNITGKEVNMLEGEYAFTVYSTEEGKGRFSIKFCKKATSEENFVYQSGDELIIEGDGLVQIIDVMGRVVYNNELNGTSRINVGHLNEAVYIVRRVNGNDIKTQKVLVF